MNAEHPWDLVARQVRLILEQQCADVARQLAARFTAGEHLILFFFDFNDTAEQPGVNCAFWTNDGAEGPVAAIRDWLEAGCQVPSIEVRTFEEGANLLHRAREVARWIAQAAPAGVGYALLVWVDGQNAFYASNAQRADVAKLFADWLAEKRWPGGEPS